MYDAFNSLLTEWSHNEVRAELKSRAHDGNSFAQWYLTYPEVGTIGEFRQRLVLGPDGRWTVEIRSLYARDNRPDYVRGIGRSLWSYERLRLQTLRVKHVELTAHEVGSYLWAAVGFLFAAYGEQMDAERGRRRMRGFLADADTQPKLAEWRGIDPKTVNFFEQVTSPRCAAAEAFWKPVQLAELQGSIGGRHFGRELLRSTSWSGIFPLN